MVNDVSTTAYDHAWDDNSFFTKVEILTEQASPDFSKTLNIAFIGKVSSGKSSLINAFLKKERINMISKVGATSGVTSGLKIIKDESMTIIDSPGLDDVRSKNSQVTQEFLKHIDVGVLVVTGSSDVTQKKYLDELRRSCHHIFVALNKIDQWDGYNSSILENVTQQWKTDIGIDKIYQVCASGYDPGILPERQLDIRGVDRLRRHIFNLLVKEGKDILLARHMAEKQSYATKIIATALVTVSTQVTLPGSAAFIVATQASAIASLYYLYNGKALAPKAAIALLPCFASEAIYSNVFLFVQSFMPPTGVLEISAAIAAITTTVAMLATVNYLLATGAELTEKERLKEVFRKYKTQATKKVFFNVDLEKLKNPDYIRETVTRFIMDQAIA